MNVGAGHFGGVAGADVFVLSVRWTVDEPSACLVVFSEVSELVLLPVSVVVLVCVRDVVVDFGGVLLPHAAVTKAAEIAMKRRRLVMCWSECKRRSNRSKASHGPAPTLAAGMDTVGARLGVSYTRPCRTGDIIVTRGICARSSA